MTGKPSSPAAMAAIEHGLTGLQEMQELSGVPRRTLADWFKAKPVTFETVAMGCKVRKELGK
jgi:hypothetical protein